MVRGGRGSELTICPFCACGCGLYLQTTDGELSGVMPSEHHRVSGGRLCARGWAAHEPGLWGGRLTQPLVRDGARPVATTWPRALASAVERMRAVLAAGGPIGVLGSGRATNEENFLAVGLARAALGTGHVDSCLRAPYHNLLTGLSPADAGQDSAPALDDLEACDVILLIEEDLGLTHPRVAHAILKAVRRGARLVTVGPARTRLSRLAWLHVPLLPGDEGALLDRLGPAGEAYAAAARSAIVIAPTGADAAGLRALGAALAGLAAGAGHPGRPGSVILPLPLRGNTRGALEMGALPDRLPGPCALDDASARGRLAKAWGGEPVRDRGLDVERMIHQVAGLIVVADDPPVSLLSETSARQALAGLDCLIVLDAFVTPTVEAAHVALPIASPAETEGTFTNLEGRIQRLRAGARPPESARPGWEVLAELGAALSLAGVPRSVDDVTARIRAAVPSYGRAPVGEPAGGEDWAWALHRLPQVSKNGAETVAATAPAAEPGDGAAFPFRLARVGAFEWGDDPLVVASPTLRRDHASLRKRFPQGLVEMNGQDAKELGIRDGWQVKLVSRRGEVLVPVSLRDDLEPRTVLVPFAFRDRLEPALGPAAWVAARVERV